MHKALLLQPFSLAKITYPDRIARLQSRLSGAAFSIARGESATQRRKKMLFPYENTVFSSSIRNAAGE